MMKTPICDFASRYANSKTIRFHMPGHKGKQSGLNEALDITEIKGADSLYSADGIIKQSEDIATALFGSYKTLYSTEGSSHVIRAMLVLAKQAYPERGFILASRNAHKTFVTATALVGVDVEWIFDSENSLLSCTPTPAQVEQMLVSMHKKPMAVYVTSPDYIGNMCDLQGLADVCHRHDTLLICDNAHGAYLRFLEHSLHPMDLGVDMCCDSAHKTLPCLTGGAYLHICKNAKFLAQNAKNALSLFGSTSPSYIILQSLDKVNALLMSGYASSLRTLAHRVQDIKQKLIRNGYTLEGVEPIKITIKVSDYGYSGNQFAEILRDKHIECEFCDNAYIVFMVTPSNADSDLDVLLDVLLSIPKREPILIKTFNLFHPQKAMNSRKAIFSRQKVVPVEKSEGMVLGVPTVSCPPAVPILVCGEVVTKQYIEVFKYYGIQEVSVIDD